MVRPVTSVSLNSLAFVLFAPLPPGSIADDGPVKIDR